jgi:hypothetical protein
MVGAGNDTVKRKPSKPAKKPRKRESPLNLNGVKFEDALKAMLATPPSPKAR